MAAGERASVRDESLPRTATARWRRFRPRPRRVATLLACAFWIGSAWPEGGTAATMAAVLSCLFAATDDPAPFALTFLWCTVASATVAGIYLLGIMPAIDGFPLLAAALACFFVPVAALLPVPALFPYAMPLAVNTAAFMAIQGAYGVDVASYLNGALAQIVGMGLAVVVLRLVRSVGATVAARRLAAATQADLVRLAAGDEALGRARFEARVLDRVGALLPRLREADPDQRRRLLDGSLLDLRVGLNLLHLHERPAPPARCRERQPEHPSAAISPRFFRRRDPVERASPPALLARLDRGARRRRCRDTLRHDHRDAPGTRRHAPRPVPRRGPADPARRRRGVPAARLEPAA